MTFKTLIIAPHPDDELLGCGGTLLRRKAGGGSIGWVLMSAITEKAGWTPAQIEQRASQIDIVRTGLGITCDNLYEFGFPTAELDAIPMNTLVGRISDVFKSFQPHEVLVPYPGDAHSDHRVTFNAAAACTKWFRYPSVNRVLAYETPSETNFGIDPCGIGFRPNFFVDVSGFLEKKIELMRVYKSELGNYPFPRSEGALRSLAQVRGAQSGFESAEGFMLLLERTQ